MSKLLKNLTGQLAWIALVIISGFLSGHLSQTHANDWYHMLHRSTLTPPDYVFGIAWSFLYATLGLAGWHIWHHNNQQLKTWYLYQLLLNWLWSPLFFYYHRINLALACLLAMTLCALILTSKAYRIHKTVAYLLGPYLLWLFFATYLNAYICLFNPGP